MNNKDTKLLIERYQQVSSNQQQVDEALGGLATAAGTGAALGTALGGPVGTAIGALGGAGVYGAGKLAGAVGRGIKGIGAGLGGMFTGQGWSAGRAKGAFTSDAIPAYEAAKKSIQQLKSMGIEIPDAITNRLGTMVAAKAQELGVPFKGPAPEEQKPQVASQPQAEQGVPTEPSATTVQKVEWPSYAWAGSELPDKEIKRYTSSTPDGKIVTSNALYKRTMPDGQNVVYRKVGQAPYAPNERIPDGDIVEVNGQKRLAQ